MRAHSIDKQIKLLFCNCIQILSTTSRSMWPNHSCSPWTAKFYKTCRPTWTPPEVAERLQIRPAPPVFWVQNQSNPELLLPWFQLCCTFACSLKEKRKEENRLKKWFLFSWFFLNCIASQQNATKSILHPGQWVLKFQLFIKTTEEKHSSLFGVAFQIGCIK